MANHNYKLDTQLRSALGTCKDVNDTKDKIRAIYADVTRRAQHHASGLITADELINHCVRADSQLYLLFNKL